MKVIGLALAVLAMLVGILTPAAYAVSQQIDGGAEQQTAQCARFMFSCINLP